MVKNKNTIISFIANQKVAIKRLAELGNVNSLFLTVYLFLKDGGLSNWIWIVILISPGMIWLAGYIDRKSGLLKGEAGVLIPQLEEIQADLKDIKKLLKGKEDI